ncbi:MAG TPA: type II secretion system protein GspN [bacterium]|jgi:type II secretion system protein N|nr:type II secretion system protein GspN [Myxococcales bacterium]OQA59967.1 MAG: hypothetical protein BWY40_01074 [bacterium ADurb.Bin270]HPW45591.1 type II secretion system protein GspN [bacterium]HQC51254.1 type II secretion system protein GspN [bacterium]HQG13033.1 type II secretion system protein GspN [bacterium]
MNKMFKYALYISLFFVSFVIFLYWSLPYSILKDRIVAAIEQQLSNKYEIVVEDFSPYWFTGIDVRGLKVKSLDEGGAELLKVNRAKGRASLTSLIFGSPKISFDLDIGRGEISGSAVQSADEILLNMSLDDVDLKNFDVVGASTKMPISSQIDGRVDLKIDRQRPIRSEGKLELHLDDIKIAATNAKLGELEMPLPDLVISKGRGSLLKLEIGKGTVTVLSFKLSGGDLELDITGKIFLSNDIANYRFNLNGTFKASETLEKALPFLFIVEKQKGEDGRYPLSITGRLARPLIKIGTFTLPI